MLPVCAHTMERGGDTHESMLLRKSTNIISLKIPYSFIPQWKEQFFLQMNIFDLAN